MNIRQVWEGLETRERRTLLLGAIALAIICYIFVIWLPAHRQADALQARVAEQRALLAWMQQAAVEAQALQAAGANPTAAAGGQSLFSLVDQSARQAGLASALRQVEPSGEHSVRVNFQQASFDALLGWLVRLKTQHGVQASLLSVRSAEAPGRVNAQLVLEGPGA